LVGRPHFDYQFYQPSPKIQMAAQAK
jgi:hypothetical protein